MINKITCQASVVYFSLMIFIEDKCKFCIVNSEFMTFKQSASSRQATRPVGRLTLDLIKVTVVTLLDSFRDSNHFKPGILLNGY